VNTVNTVNTVHTVNTVNTVNTPKWAYPASLIHKTYFTPLTADNTAYLTLCGTTHVEHEHKHNY